MVFIHKDGILRYANKSACRFLGVADQSAIIGKQVVDFFHEDAKSPSPAEITLKGIAGKLLYSQTRSIEIMYNGEPAILTVAGRAEEESPSQTAYQNRRFIQTLADISPVIFYVYDIINNKNNYVNRRITEVLRYTPGEVRNMGEDFLKKVIHPEDFPGIRKNYSAIMGMKGNAVQEIDYRVRRRDGKWLWFHDRVTVLERTKEGTPWRMLGVSLDITERKQMEMALAETKEMLQAVIDQTPVAIIGLDMEGRVRTWNPGARRIFGWNAEDVIGGHNPIIPDDQYAAHEKGLDILSTDVQVIEEHIVGKTRTGKNVDLYMAANPLKNADGGITGYVALFIDITRQVRSKQELLESEEKFRHLFNGMVSGFALMEILRDHAGNPVDMRYQMLNPAHEKLTGLRNCDILGKSARSVIPRLEDSWIRRYAQVADTGNPMEFEDYSGGLNRWFRVGVYRVQTDLVAVTFENITKRKKAEISLRDSELRYRHFMQNFPGIVYSGRMDFAPIFIHGEIEELTGYTYQEFMEKKVKWHNLIHPDDMMSIISSSKRLQQYPGVQEIREFRLFKKQGQMVWIREYVHNIADESGIPERLEGAVFDITSQKETEQRLEKELVVNEAIAKLSNHLLIASSLRDISDYTLNTALELTKSPIGFVGYIDPETGFLICPTMAGEVWEKCNVPGKTHVFPEFSGLWGWSLKNRQPVLSNQVDTDPRSSGTPTGHIPITRFLSAPALFGENLVGQIALANSERDYTGEDLTIVERMAAIFALGIRRKRAEHSMRNLAEAAFEAVVFHEMGIPVYVNRQYLDMFGYNEKEVIGNPDILFKTMVHESYARARRLISENNYDPYEATGIRKNGTQFPVLIQPRVMEFEGRNLRVGVIRDLTKEKETQKELIFAKEAAEAANLQKDRFLANITHELRTPLNGILGYTQILKREKNLSQIQEEAIEIIHKSGEHLLQVISDILDISKIEAGGIRFVPSEFQLIEFLENISDMTRIKAMQKGIEWRFEMKGNLPLWVLGDATRLRQVLLNLLGNAIKFTDKGFVKLCVTRLDQPEEKVQETPGKAKPEGTFLHTGEKTIAKISFSVEDTGCGMDPEEIARIFDPFYQAATNAKMTEGTGLGLSICREIISLMGSRIHVETGNNQGARFYFTVSLPVAEIKPRKPLFEKKISGYKGKGKTILVADDDPETRRLLKDTLCVLGFHVITADKGEKGVALFVQYNPDLVIMDMQGMNGFAAARKMMDWFEDQIKYKTGHFRCENDINGKPDSATLYELTQKGNKSCFSPNLEIHQEGKMGNAWNSSRRDEGKKHQKPVLIGLVADVAECEKSGVPHDLFADILQKPVSISLLFGMLEKHLDMEWTYGPPEDMHMHETCLGEDMAGVDREVLDQLYHLARVGDILALQRKGNEMREENSPASVFGEKLFRLAKNMEIDAIKSGLKAILDRETSV